MLARELSRCPVAEYRAEVAPADCHVAEDPLHALAVARRARACSTEDLALHGVPGEGQRLAGDDIEAHVVRARERDAVGRAGAAELHPLFRALDQRRLGG